MLTRSLLLGMRQWHHVAMKHVSRNFGASAVVTQKAADPIQQLFLEKVREYAQKSKGSGGLVDVTPDIERSLQDQLDKLSRQYGATGVDFTKFPTFDFTDPQLDPVGVEVEARKEADELTGESEGDFYFPDQELFDVEKQ